jgi:hypothetical protein
VESVVQEWAVKKASAVKVMVVKDMVVKEWAAWGLLQQLLHQQ